jgi:hypothetical protein
MAFEKAGLTLKKSTRPSPIHESATTLYCKTTSKMSFRFEKQWISPKFVKRKKNIKSCPKVGLHKDMH